MALERSHQVRCVSLNIVISRWEEKSRRFSRCFFERRFENEQRPTTGLDGAPLSRRPKQAKHNIRLSVCDGRAKSEGARDGTSFIDVK